MLILLIESVCVPVFVMVTVCGELTVPTVWFPNERPVGVIVTWVDEAIPVPERAMVCGLPAALSVILICPAIGPMAVGVNVTSIVQEPPPAAMVPPPPQVPDFAKLSVVTVVVVVEMSIAEIVNGAVPALIMETV